MRRPPRRSWLVLPLALGATVWLDMHWHRVDAERRLAQARTASPRTPGLPASTAGWRVRCGPGGLVRGRLTTRVGLARGAERRDFWLDRRTGEVVAAATSLAGVGPPRPRARGSD
jgi:hypothetical protein